MDHKTSEKKRPDTEVVKTKSEERMGGNASGRVQPTNDDVAADDNAFMADKEGRKRHSAQDVKPTWKEEIQEHYEMRSKRLNCIGFVCYKFQSFQLGR